MSKHSQSRQISLQYDIHHRRSGKWQQSPVVAIPE